MKIVYLAAGAANMYCGSCLRDNTLATALLAAGHEVLLVPTYTPIRTDERDVSEHRVFFGGINVYLQQHSALFRHTPWFVDRMLDSPGLLRWLAGKASTVQAESLGDMTVSMIHGETGRQAKELAKLVQWLAHEKPDVVHLSNAMMIGMAREITRHTGAPVVCTLSGEDIFLEKLLEPFHSECQQALRDRAGDAAAYVALNQYYADYMVGYMGIDPGRVSLVPIGLNLEGHASVPPEPRPADRARTIGFLARICQDKGLHLLIEAFHLLSQDRRLPPLKLKVAGYLGQGDRPYFDAVRSRVQELGLADRFEYAGELDRAEKIQFLQSLDLFCVPTVYRESKGLSIVEALANGVPVVLPAHGAFPEIVRDTGAGLLFEPMSSKAAADAMGRLLLDDAERQALGHRGHAAVHDRYHAQAMAEKTLAVYERVRAR